MLYAYIIFCLYISSITGHSFSFPPDYSFSPFLLPSLLRKVPSMCRRGAIVTTFIVCYALTSFISGYVSGGMYSRNGGKNLR